MWHASLAWKDEWFGHMEEDQKKDTAGKRNIMNKSKVGMQDVCSGNTSNSIWLKDRDRNKVGKKGAGQIAENFILQTGQGI